MHRIKYSNQSQLDLERAISHIADESISNALDYLSRYEDKIDLLRLNPFMGVECKNKLIKRDCRVLVHESHIIIYMVGIDISEVFIIRIYHGSVNYAHRLSREVT